MHKLHVPDTIKHCYVHFLKAPLTSKGMMQLGPMSLGRMDIKYRRVNCKPPVNMLVDVDSSSGPGGWIRMTVKVSLPRVAVCHGS